MNWDEMTYDEQRALLGLPDVRRAVAWGNLLRTHQALAEGIGRAFGAMAASLPTQSDYALANDERTP